MPTPEQTARERIDTLLTSAGWLVQDAGAAYITAAQGVAIREFPLQAGRGTADYLLYVDGRAAGVIEAKKEGHTLSGVETQSAKYSEGLPPALPSWSRPLPFAYQSTGVETHFTNGLDPEPRSRALIQMATGSGKTFTAITFVCRLIKFARARRVLFLVDRGNLADQPLKEFQQYASPYNNFKLTEEYIVQRLTSNTLDTTARVCICTIQAVLLLKGKDPPEDLEGAPRRSELARDPATRAHRIQPEYPNRNVRHHRHRRMPPLHLQPLGPGAGVLRRLPQTPPAFPLPGCGGYLAAGLPGGPIAPRWIGRFPASAAIRCWIICASMPKRTVGHE